MGDMKQWMQDMKEGMKRRMGNMKGAIMMDFPFITSGLGVGGGQEGAVEERKGKGGRGGIGEGEGVGGGGEGGRGVGVAGGE